MSSNAFLNDQGGALPRVALLGRRGQTLNVIYHALSREFLVDPVIVEADPSRASFVWRRIRRLGWWPALGQLAFSALVEPVLAYRSRRRRAEILATAGLRHGTIDVPIISVYSANHPDTWRLLRDCHPSAVVVAGARILSDSTLRSGAVPFLNVHAGITPGYRGVHGGYWAVAMHEPDACGVTVHLVDRGIDTGRILAQTVISPGEQDDFTTYPVLQLVAGIPLLIQALRDVISGELSGRSSLSARPSRLWSHPTIWRYLWTRITRGVR